jgi:hypothetical protein
MFLAILCFLHQHLLALLEEYTSLSVFFAQVFCAFRPLELMETSTTGLPWA